MGVRVSLRLTLFLYIHNTYYTHSTSLNYCWSCCYCCCLCHCCRCHCWLLLLVIGAAAAVVAAVIVVVQARCSLLALTSFVLIKCLTHFTSTVSRSLDSFIQRFAIKFNCECARVCVYVFFAVRSNFPIIYCNQQSNRYGSFSM